MSEMAIGMVGLGVMGRNLALNIEEKGFPRRRVGRVAGAGRQVRRRRPTGKQIAGFKDARRASSQSLRRPRRIIMLVKAGEVVDKTIAALRPLLETGDMLVDGGNEYFKNTERRAQELEADGHPLLRHGRLRRRGRARARSVDDAGRRPRAAYDDAGADPDEDRRAGRRTARASPTSGPGGAGHYVKMVHNGIEYGDMQLIAEAYDVLQDARRPLQRRAGRRVRRRGTRASCSRSSSRSPRRSSARRIPRRERRPAST